MSILYIHPLLGYVFSSGTFLSGRSMANEDLYLTLQYTDKVSLGYSTQLGLMADLVSR